MYRTVIEATKGVNIVVRREQNYPNFPEWVPGLSYMVDDVHKLPKRSYPWMDDAHKLISQPSAEVVIEMPPEYYEALNSDRRSTEQKLRDTIAEIRLGSALSIAAQLTPRNDHTVEPEIVYDGEMLNAMDKAAERAMAKAKDDAYAATLEGYAEDMREVSSADVKPTKIMIIDDNTHFTRRLMNALRRNHHGK